MPTRAFFIVISLILLLVFGGVFIFFFFRGTGPAGAALLKLGFPDFSDPRRIESSTITASFSRAFLGLASSKDDEKLVLTVFGQDSRKKDRKDIEIDVLKQELENKSKKGIVVILLKRPDPSLKKIICDLGVDNICELAFDRSYFDYTSSRNNFFPNQGTIIFTLNGNTLSGEIIKAETKEGATLSGTFNLKLKQDVAGSPWSAAEISQAEKALSLIEKQTALNSQERNEERVANLRLLQLGLTIYQTKNKRYPLSETPEKINHENFKNSVLYKTLTVGNRFGVNPDSFPLDPSADGYFQYQSFNGGQDYLLTAQMEGAGLANGQLYSIDTRNY